MILVEVGSMLRDAFMDASEEGCDEKEGLSGAGQGNLAKEEVAGALHFTRSSRRGWRW